ncbi:hypothetical protein SLS55_004614 [Diplodia seriata]|uniref:Ankyrin repeat protein n=1 Tax=Diplodia seriata TaxID=420778 RepID=A0ABR3CJW8_9PEZI
MTRADINDLIYPAGGYTALQIAAQRGLPGLASFLLRKGADVNASPAKSRRGRTALEYAAEYGRLDMVQLLIDAGAEIPAPGTQRSRRLIGFASRNSHDTVVKVLKGHQGERYGGFAVDFMREEFDDDGYDTEPYFDDEDGGFSE